MLKLWKRLVSISIGLMPPSVHRQLLFSSRLRTSRWHQPKLSIKTKQHHLNSSQFIPSWCSQLHVPNFLPICFSFLTLAALETVPAKELRASVLALLKPWHYDTLFNCMICILLQPNCTGSVRTVHWVISWAQLDALGSIQMASYGNCLVAQGAPSFQHQPLS